MERFSEIFQSLIVETLNETYQFLISVAPNILITLMILLIGWICAIIIKKIIAKILRALGFDVIAQKSGLRKFLEKGGIVKTPSHMVGLAFYWLIMFSALLMVFNTLDLQGASQLINQVILYIPKIVVALILLTLGVFLGQFLGNFVERTSQLANISFYKILGEVARYAVIGLAIMMVLEQLEVAKAITIQSFIVIFAVFPALLVLVLVVGAREILLSIVAGRLLQRNLKIGDKIQAENFNGEIINIDLISVKIKNGETEILIPNSLLSKNIVFKNK